MEQRKRTNMFLDKMNGVIEWKSVEKFIRKTGSVSTTGHPVRSIGRLQVVHFEVEFTSCGCATRGISWFLFQRAW
jgi:hypothetical protein